MAIHSGLAMELPANTLLRGLEADPAERPKLKMAEGPFPIDELRLESAKRGDPEPPDDTVIWRFMDLRKFRDPNGQRGVVLSAS
jgi:hypothetical protein